MELTECSESISNRPRARVRRSRVEDGGVGLANSLVVTLVEDAIVELLGCCVDRGCYISSAAKSGVLIRREALFTCTRTSVVTSI
jgi:hypothetical protein